MRLMLFGDSHCNNTYLRAIMQKAKEFGCDAICSVGDFGYWPRDPLGTLFLDNVDKMAGLFKLPVYWIDGNHEDFFALEDVHGGLSLTDDFISIREHITYIPRGCTWEWDGLKYMAMGGAFSIDRRWRTLGESWFLEEEIRDVDLAKAEKAGKIDVLISHDSPQSVDLRQHISWYKQITESYFNRRQLQKVVDATDPKLIVHGHYHCPYVDLSTGRKVVGLAHDEWDRSINDKFWIIDGAAE